jgi:glycosyltransferase involved in cell wall biosynthesis
MVLRRLFRIPVVLTEHNGQFESLLKRPGSRWMAQRAYAGADVVIAVGETHRQNLVRYFHGIKRLTVVPNVVNADQFVPTLLPPTKDGYRLLFIGLLDPVKGLPVLLDALAQIKRLGSLRVHLDLVGDGSERAKLESLSVRLGLDDMVTFHGVQPHAAIPRFLQQSHALVLPSLSESFSVVIIEALAAGRPVISTRCGGPEYLVNAANGLLVEPGQSGPLAAGIMDLLTHLDGYDPQSIAADAANRYGYSAVTAELTSIYRTLVPSVVSGQCSLTNN